MVWRIEFIRQSNCLTSAIEGLRLRPELLRLAPLVLELLRQQSKQLLQRLRLHTELLQEGRRESQATAIQIASPVCVENLVVLHNMLCHLINRHCPEVGSWHLPLRLPEMQDHLLEFRVRQVVHLDLLHSPWAFEGLVQKFGSVRRHDDNAARGLRAAIKGAQNEAQRERRGCHLARRLLPRLCPFPSAALLLALRIICLLFLTFRLGCQSYRCNRQCVTGAPLQANAAWVGIDLLNNKEQVLECVTLIFASPAISDCIEVVDEREKLDLCFHLSHRETH